MAKTRIVIIQMKEIIYTALFVVLGILLILLLIFMFLPNKDSTEETSTYGTYQPGIYTSQFTLNDTLLNVEVVVDADHINSVRLVNIDDTVTAMFPLMEPAMEQIATQLCNDVPINEVVISEESKYTQTLLLEAVKNTLEKAKKSTETQLPESTNQTKTTESAKPDENKKETKNAETAVPE